MTRRALTILYTAGLLFAAFTVIKNFVGSGHWLSAFLYGVLVPVGAVIEWRRANRRGGEAAEVAQRMIVAVLVAMIGIGSAGGGD